VLVKSFYKYLDIVWSTDNVTLGITNSFLGTVAGGGVTAEELGGMVLLAPTSVSVTGSGSSATIEPNGSISFTNCESLTLNGVFSADYKNYVLNQNHTMNTNIGNLLFGQFTSSGIPAASNYRYQRLRGYISTCSTASYTSQSYMWLSYTAYHAGGTNGVAFRTYFNRPYLSSSTGFHSRSNSCISGYNLIENVSGVHETASSYDGIKLYVSSGELITGNTAIYGLVG
jgi:hypothetical protein